MEVPELFNTQHSIIYYTLMDSKIVKYFIYQVKFMK